MEYCEKQLMAGRGRRVVGQSKVNYLLKNFL